MLKYFSLFIILYIFSLSGNAQSNGLPVEQSSGDSKVIKVTSVQPIPGKNPNKSFIYIYRTTSNSGGSAPIKIQMPGSVISISNNASYSMEVIPGEVNLISLNPESVHKNASLKLNVQKGKVYCVWVGFEKFAEIALNETDEETAKIMMNK